MENNMERFWNISLKIAFFQFCQWADAVIFVYSVTCKASFEKVKLLYREMSKYRHLNDLPLLLVGTKVRLLTFATLKIEKCRSIDFKRHSFSKTRRNIHLSIFPGRYFGEEPARDQWRRRKAVGRSAQTMRLLRDLRNLRAKRRAGLQGWLVFISNDLQLKFLCHLPRCERTLR